MVGKRSAPPVFINMPYAVVLTGAGSRRARAGAQLAEPRTVRRQLEDKTFDIAEAVEASAAGTRARMPKHWHEAAAEA